MTTLRGRCRTAGRWPLATPSPTRDRCLLAGYSDGHIRLFDLRTNTLRWQASLSSTCLLPQT